MLRNREFWLVVASGLLLGVLGVLLSSGAIRKIRASASPVSSKTAPAPWGLHD